jgi:predicted dehydrogenase
MKALIIGAGRMGVRHAQGLKTVEGLSSAVVSDINETVLENAKQQIDDLRFNYSLLDKVDGSGYDICVIAATASNRIDLVKKAQQLKAKHILIEKPLGQSLAQVKELFDYAQKSNLNCYVNLNMRLYESFINLKNDLNNLPQLQGEKTITVNTGTLGIGANGIHYLDLLYFLLDADEAELTSAEVDEQVIPSGRGPQFGDFGGWALIKFYKNKNYLGKAFLSMSATSTVFGSWEIVGPHGRIYFNEVEGRRIDTLRKPDSQMPVNRYFADYLPPSESKFVSPFLGDLTANWARSLEKGNSSLPRIGDSIKVHKLLFDWLDKSKTHKEVYPIT